jgi:hypothetical protein
MTDSTPNPLPETPPILYCANHPNVETSLRCNNCNKPVCPKCVVLTPTGYRCKECVSGHQKVFETAIWYDYPVAFFTAGLLSFLGSLLVGFLGFLTLFVAPIAGTIIGEIVRLLVRRRRSRLLFQIAAGAAALGSLIPICVFLTGGMLGSQLSSMLLPLVWQGIYTLAVTSTVYYRLGGIQIK